MANYIEYITESNNKVIIESSVDNSMYTDQIVEAAIDSRSPVKVVKEQFDQSIENNIEFINELAQKIKKTSLKPDDIEISVGLKASAEVNGFYICKGGLEGNINLKLIWKKD